ncbi:MAG: heparinase II/III family protein [Verrucomicrobiota bacterium]
MKCFSLFLICWLTGVSLWTACAQTSDILTGLRPGHPRLIVTTADWGNLRARRAGNPELNALLAKIVNDARKALKVPPLVYKKEGIRLLAVSREAVRRIQLYAFAYRITGEKVFLDRAQSELLNLAAFKDWNPSHFLDVAEMTTAVALGYDWLFDALPAATRATLKQAIIEKGIKPGLAVQKGWPTTVNNWNQVCFGGLTLGALAIGDETPDLAREILTRAQRNISYGLKSYVPSGIYPEGPGYWGYGTTYQVLMISALQTALGTDWNLSASPGFMASAAALVEQTGPTGRQFNFSDCGDGVAFDPTLFWFAQQQHNPVLVYFQNQLLLQNLADPRNREREADRFFPLLALWVSDLPPQIPLPTRLPLAWHGDGVNPVGVFRSSWTDPNALFLAFKGGSARNNHAHMDAGSFVFEANGVRWANDLGAQSYYSIESKGWKLWDSAQNSDRWRVYRLNNFSHNTLTLGGKLHTVAGDARITEFNDTSATVNLSEIFVGQAGSVKRKYSMNGNKTVSIRDDIAAAKPGLSVRWQMLTQTKITANNNQATLQQGSRTLTAKIISPAGARFEIASAQPPDDGVNQPNPKSQLLMVNTTVPTSGNLAVEIQLQP